MLRRTLALAAFAAASTASAQQMSVPVEKIDTAMNAKIRAEEMNHSKIMWIEHYLTDVYGPRPIGSPNHVAAANWAVKTMTDFGMKNAHLEPFDCWPGVGWMPGRAVGYITSPVKANIKFESNPWSPSTKGTIKGTVVVLVAPVEPTPAEMDAYLLKMAPKVKGGIVMLAPETIVPVNFNPRELRTPDSVAMARYMPRDSAAGGGGRGGRGGGRGGPAGGGRGGRAGGAGAPPPAGHLSAQEVTADIAALVRDNMPALRINPQGGGRIPGEIVAQNGAGQIYSDTVPQPATIIMRTDDYNRIWRINADGTPVTVEFNMENTFYPAGKTSYVTVGEIPGTDKADEVVMMGGHLDSWTSATGATDNAIGCAIMMEAARILEAIGAKPRRTIRVALWSGEEEGEYGSKAYVRNHFATAENPTPEFFKLDAYWNIDDGTGRVRGGSIFGPPETAAILGQYIKPFSDLGAYGATATTSRAGGSSSDNDSFDEAGLPGIGGNQDPIEYNSVTWHSNLDTYDRIVPQDVMTNAIVSAAMMIGLANRDEMLPRFAQAQPSTGAALAFGPDVPVSKTVIPAGGGGRGGAGGGGARGGAPAAAPDTTPPMGTPHVYVIVKDVAFSKADPGVVAAAAGRGGRGGGGGGRAPETVAVVTKPAHGTLTLKPTGGFTYTPKAAFVGTDSFTYTITRGTQVSEPTKVSFVVR